MAEHMNADEIVKALRRIADQATSASLNALIINGAADLIKSQAAEITAFKALCEITEDLPICEGCDGKTEDGVRTEKCEYTAEHDYCSPKCTERLVAYIKEHKRLKQEITRLAEAERRERAANPKIIPTGTNMGKVCCPACDHVFFHCYEPGKWNKYHERRKYCENCGQKLEWRDPQEAGKGEAE